MQKDMVKLEYVNNTKSQNRTSIKKQREKYVNQEGTKVSLNIFKEIFKEKSHYMIEDPQGKFACVLKKT